MFSCIPDSADHALDTSVAKASWYDYAVAAVQFFSGVFIGYALGLYPLYIHLGAVFKAAVTESFGNGKIGILKLDILAHKSDRHLPGAALYPFDHFVPILQVGSCVPDMQMLADHLCQPFLFKPQRHLIERRGS